MNKRLKYGFITVASFLVIILVGVTYAFFNYTRTSTANNVRVGNIYFSSNQGTTINLTNMFPMAGREAENANLDTITISLQGNTNYSGGEEFVVRVVELSNGAHDAALDRRLPLSFIATYEATNGNTIGTSSDNYWSDRNTAESSIYKLVHHGIAEINKEILIGYIAPGDTGINGTLTIKAYIDSSKVAISDTYTDTIDYGYGINPNMTTEELNYCITFIKDYYYVSASDPESAPTAEQARLYCLGKGSIDGWSFKDDMVFIVDDEEDLNDLLEHNIVLPGSYFETPTEWRNNRRVFTTNEWNEFSTTPISFKIKIESREGIWVNGSGTTDTCEGCKFLYSSNEMYTTWNILNKTPTVLTTGLYDNYLELIDSTDIDYFLGVKLNSSNQVASVYSCAIIKDTPYCMESKRDGSLYEGYKTVLNNYYDNDCRTNNFGNWQTTECGPWDNSGNIGAYITSEGVVNFAFGYNDDCQVFSSGVFTCHSKLHFK